MMFLKPGILRTNTNDNLIEVKNEDASTEKVCGEELGAINENDEGFTHSLKVKRCVSVSVVQLTSHGSVTNVAKASNLLYFFLLYFVILWLTGAYFCILVHIFGFFAYIYIL